MSTLEYLDEEGTVTNFTLVPWEKLNNWLSELNGSPHYTEIPTGVNRGKVLEELEARRKGKDSAFGSVMKVVGKDRGYGRDWREYENKEGLTHLEELLVYQPKDWRIQAREYLFKFKCDLDRTSSSDSTNRVVYNGGKRIVMKRPVEVVLFHSELNRAARYDPLLFLLSYDVCNPLPDLTKDMDKDKQLAFMEYLSPLDYFFEFQEQVASYDLELLHSIGKEKQCPRIALIKELDFSYIIGQRLAKDMIRTSVVSHIYNRSSNEEFCSSSSQPLSMIFAGPSGNGKTELSICLSKLLNKPENHTSHFHKVDCGKLMNANEIFGMSGAYHGSKQGSALNNFVVRMSSEPRSIGVVLLDEIEKAHQEVITSLYQVLDKGEWTNKRLTSGNESQTETIPCHNIIFIMTTNACDKDIQVYASNNKDELYVKSGVEFSEAGEALEHMLRGKLSRLYPFTDAFIGRVNHIVPFLHMARADTSVAHPLMGELATVAKILIEKEQAKVDSLDVEQSINIQTKDKMAKIIVQEAIPEAGVRSIETQVKAKMSRKILHSVLLKKGGIQKGSKVEYHAEEDDKTIDFRIKESGSNIEEVEDKDDLTDLWG